MIHRRREAEKTWEKSAGFQVILNSIFAVLAAALIPLAIGDFSVNRIARLAELVAYLFSFLFLAMSAEGSINAYDDKDVRKYVYYLLWYNLGVILLGLGIAGTVWERCLANFVWPLPEVLWWPVLIFYFLMFLLLLWHWSYDAWFLFHTRSGAFSRYLRELEDEEPPELFRPRLMKFLGFSEQE